MQPPGQVVDLISQLQAKGHDGRGDILRGVVSGDLGVFDCRGYRLAQLTESQDIHQWIAVRTLTDVPEEVREATTRTTTWMQPERPPMLLGQVAGFSTDELPLRLHPVHLVPEGLRQAYGSRIPAAQLRLFPQLDPTSAGTKSVPFSLLMRGFPPARLQGAARWSLIDFVNDAVSQCDRPPRRAQLLTTSLAGVDEPQIVVTEHTDSDDPHACVVPIDLRGMQGEVIPVVLVPGMGLPEVLQAAAEHLPALPTALQVLGSEAHSEMFMQDAQGQVYEVLPQNLLHLQWLIIRPRSEAPFLQPLFGPTSTTTTTTCMLATGQEDPRTVQFIMVGDGTTVRLVETPYSQADPHLAVLELIRALARLGRLQADFTVQLAPVLPRTTAATRYIVPLLYVPQQSSSEEASGTITVLYDPGVDGTQVHAMILPEGARPSEILSEVQKRSGAQIFVNGVHSNVCSRPLMTGDFIQQMGAGRFPGVARNIGPLLDDISRLRCLSFPMSLPALGLFLGPQGPLVAPRVGIQSIEERLDDAFERRLDQLGRPARTSKRITVFQPGRAPHIFWIDTPLTPTVFEACEHLEGTGLFTSGMQLVDVASNVEVWGADAFIAMPAEVSWVTCTINDPFAVLYYLLVHFPQGAQPPIDYLPLRPGMMFRPMPRIVNGAHIGHTRAPRAPSATGSGHVHQQSTPRAASRPSSGGTSLVQLTFPKARRRQVIFDDTPEARRAALIEATGASTRPAVIPTPCGRRRLGPQSATPGDAKPARLCLEQLVPEPPPVVTWEVNADILDSALTGHGHANFCQALPPAIAPTAHARIWADIPAFAPDSRVDGLFLFTDGSFFPGQTSASWAVVALALQDGQIRRFGHLSGVCTTVLPSASTTHVASAFDGELEALLHAQATCAKVKPRICHFGCDCESALAVAFGFAGFDVDSRSSASAVGLAAFLATQGVQICLHKVEAHMGCVFNTLADLLAKQAITAPSDCPGSKRWEHFQEAIDERVFERAWLLPGPICSAVMPPLRQDGTWAAPFARIRSPQPNPIPEPIRLQEAITGDLSLSLRMLTYNVLSARGATAQELLYRGLQKHQVDIAGFQETREKTHGIASRDAFWVLSAPCDDCGQGGTQLWLRKSVGWERNSFAIVHASPRVLLVVCTLKGVKFVLASAHALTSVSPEVDIRVWWQNLRGALAKTPCACAPLLFLDANARYVQQDGRPATEDSAPANLNAECLRTFATEVGVHVSAQQDRPGHFFSSWRSPNSQQGLIDYVCCPVAWGDRHVTLGNVDLGDLHADQDHMPVMTSLKATIQSSTLPDRRRVDAQSLTTVHGQCRAAQALASTPLVPWQETCTSHVEAVQQSLMSELADTTVKGLSAPRHPAVTEATLELVRHRRHLRRVLKVVGARSDRGFLQLCFQAWQRHDVPPASTYSHAKAARYNMARSYHQLHQLDKRLKTAMQSDKAEFARKQIEAARDAGPAEFAHRIRALLRTGRKFRPPPLLPALTAEPNRPCLREEVQDTFARHFASAERASCVEADVLVQEAAIDTLPALAWDGTALPTIADLTRGFASLKRAKAPGPSGIPAEIFLASPLLAAIRYWPVLAKELVRDKTAMQWRGGMAVPVPKPSKAPDACTGFRSIALLETDGKAVQKSMRPQVMSTLRHVRAADQFGGMPKCTLGLPIACVRAHFDSLRREGCSGAAIFVDCTTAYYSVIKDMLVLTDSQRRDQELLAKRARLLFDTEEHRAAFVQKMQQGDLAAALSCKPELRELVRKHLTEGWFVCRPGTGTVYRTECGTIPGAPLADALFSLIIAGALREMKSHIADRGWEPVFCRRQSGAGSTPTWADDTCLLLRIPDPAELTCAVQTITTLMVKQLQEAGLNANFGAGKTEVMVAFHGRGSKTCKVRLLNQAEPVIQLPELPGVPGLRIVPEYTYLGALVRADGQELPGLRYRRAQMMSIFKPLKAKLLWNPCFSFAEKQDLLRSRVLSRFMYGAGHWTLNTERERQLFAESIHGVYRSSFRPMIGVSSCRFTNEEVASALEMALPSELLTTERARLLVQLCAHGLHGVLNELHCQTAWWDAACQAAVEIGLVPRAIYGPADIVPLLATATRRAKVLCRAFLRKACKARRLPTGYVVARARGEPLHMMAPQCEQLPFSCEVCGNAFRSKRLLSIHRANAHKMLAEHRLVAFGTSCQVCGIEFWSEARLAGHLKHATLCRTVYREADITDGCTPAPLDGGARVWLPAQATHGPQPWWATLRPDPGT